MLFSCHERRWSQHTASGTGTSAVTQLLENLKTLIIAVIGVVGVIILAKNETCIDFVQCLYETDVFYKIRSPFLYCA